MTEKEFRESIAENNMHLRMYEDGTVEVGKEGFANPLLIFNKNERGSTYNGSITIKIINAGLFGPIQMAMAFDICHNYLSSAN